MLTHPNLIYDAPHPYFGMRDRTRKPCGRLVEGLRPRFTAPQIRDAIGRAQPTWASWEAHHKWGRAGNTDSENRAHATAPKNPMPQYMSAYMALLCGGHRTHTLERAPVIPSMFPVIPKVENDAVRALMEQHELMDYDVVEAFNFDADNRQYSVKTLGNCGVRWLMLRLMVDDAAPYVSVRLRAPEDVLVSPPNPVIGAEEFIVASWDVTIKTMRLWLLSVSAHPHLFRAADAGVLPAAAATWTHGTQRIHARMVWVKANHPAVFEEALRAAERFEANGAP